MIDIENLVFDTVFNAVRTVHSNMNVTKGFIEENAKFPCIVVREVNNVPLERTNTDDCAENFSRLTYQIDVYSDKAGTQRSECRDLLNLVDGIMQTMKFKRIHMNEPLNIKRSIFRQYARYSVIADKGITTTTGTGNEQVTTTTFHMFRR